MKRYIIVSMIVAVGVLYWAVSNPNSAKNVKKGIDNLANVCSDYYEEMADKLTDD